MQRYIAFLRGINLGKRRLAMSTLVDLFEGMGFHNVQTFIASGNVIFESPVTDHSQLEARIASQLESALKFPVETFIRTEQAVVHAGQSKVFPDQEEAGITVHVGFLHEPLSKPAAKKLEAIRTPHDEFTVKESEIYWLCRILSSQSKVWTLSEVKALRLPSMTMRNLKSVRKLIAQRLAS